MKSTPYKLRNVNKSEIGELYNLGWSAKRISEKYNVSEPTIFYCLRDLGIQKRSRSSAQTTWLSRQVNVICESCNKEFKTISSRLQIGKGKFCSRSCYKLGKSKSYRGKNNPNWIDGRSPLVKNIRSSMKYDEWRKSVFSRDNYTCVMCGATNCWIEADHIKRFIDIFNEYNIQSLEDADKCLELWNIDNGRTLCKPCHKEITFK